MKPDGRGIITPRDEEKGGTWMGVGQDGWFVGITNQDDGKHDEHKLSRGQVVTRVLEAGNHRDAARVLASLDPVDYNPFNLVFGRPGALFLTRVCCGTHIDMEPLPAGISIISNDCCGDRYQKKVARARELANVIDVNGGELASCEVLFRLLGDHANGDDDPFQSLCVHAHEFSFGTRSTSVITVSNQGVVEYWFSEGPTCQSDGLTLAGRLLHLDFSDLEPIALKDEDIEVIG